MLPAALLFLAGCEELPPPPGFGDVVPLVSPGAGTAVGPRLNAGDGRIVLSWMERADKGGTLWHAELGDDGWGEPLLVVEDPDMFVNWADFPSVLPLGDGRWFTHWLSFSAEGAYSYDVRVAFADGEPPVLGTSFSPHDDGTPTEHGFVSSHASGDSRGLMWLDGRNTLSPAAAADHDGEHVGHAGGMTLRAAMVDADGNVIDEQEVDDLVCDCCQTDMAVGSKGPIAAYRNRTNDEIRDIYISRFVDGAWQPGERFSFDDWHITGCPVNGPAVAAHGDLVVVAWFTAADDTPMLSARLSTDGGTTFGERLILARNNVLGHADAVAVDGNSVIVSWLENGKQDLDDVRVRSLGSDGRFGPVQTVGRTALMRIVPQLALNGDELILAWSDDIGGERRVSSIRLPIVPRRD